MHVLHAKGPRSPFAADGTDQLLQSQLPVMPNIGHQVVLQRFIPNAVLAH